MVEIRAERADRQTGHSQREQRYYILDLLQPAKSFNDSIRSHWGIKKSQQWVLDVACSEDQSRKRAKACSGALCHYQPLGLELAQIRHHRKGQHEVQMQAGRLERILFGTPPQPPLNLDAFALRFEAGHLCCLYIPSAKRKRWQSVKQ